MALSKQVIYNRTWKHKHPWHAKHSWYMAQAKRFLKHYATLADLRACGYYCAQRKRQLERGPRS